MGAVVNNRLETARVLVERGAALDVQETENGQTALMWAVRNRNPEMVQLLVEAGADTTLTPDGCMGRNEKRLPWEPLAKVGWRTGATGS